MKEIKFADVGEGITEGHMLKLLVNDGDQVNEDQSIFQIETDKAVVNIPAPIDGKVKFAVKEDSIVHVGDTIAYIGTDDELKSVGATKAAAQQQPAKSTAPKTAETKQAQQKPKEIIATPAVRKLARDLSVDLSTIVGTGPEG